MRRPCMPCCHEVNAFQAGFVCQFLPQANKSGYVGKVVRNPDIKQRFSVDGYIAFVAECRQAIVEVCNMVVGSRVFLTEYHGIFSICFAFGPGFVGPGMVGPSQTEREVGFAACENFFERPFQNLFTVAKPVVPVHESLDTGLTCHVGLGFSHFGQPQVVKSEVGRKFWLIMSGK